MINIFEVDPAEAAAKRESDDFIGSLRSGQALNGRPMSLPTWRFTTEDMVAADAIAAEFGGVVEGWETKSREAHQVITEATELPIVLQGIKTEMVLWGLKGKIRSCDGIAQTADDKGNCADCACPSALPDRKAASKAGTGCTPSLGLFFRVDVPSLVDLGLFRFYSGAWTFAKDLAPVEAAFNEFDGACKATIGKERVEFTASDGAEIKFTKPVLTLGEQLGAVTGNSEPF